MATMKDKKGVDISSCNGDINIGEIKKAGYDFVMIRCGYGSDIKSQDDTQFENNVRKCESAGLPWGAYLYSYALNVEQAKSEVEHVKRLLKGKKPTLPIAIDIEDADGYHAKNGAWNFKVINAVTKTFIEGIRSAGYYPMLYTGFEELNYLISSEVANSVDIWFAQWWKTCDYKGANLGMWQYGGETNYIESNSISGVGVIDKNKCYKDYPSIIKNGGYNGWKKSTPAPTPLKLCCSYIHTYANCQYALWQIGATNPKWSVTNSAMSRIDSNGVLTVTAAGTTTVILNDGNRSLQCKVNVQNGKPTGISASKMTLAKGKTGMLTAKTTGVSWFSSNPNVATVSGGKVTAKGVGYASISAYTKSGASTCLVQVVAAQSSSTSKSVTTSKSATSTGITEQQLRQKCVNVINSWMGAVEGGSVHASILNIYNSRKNLDYRMGVHDAWCATTVSATWLKVGIGDYVPLSVNCGIMRDKAIGMGMWIENDAYKPKIADAVIYNWSDSGYGDNRGSADHIGMVTEVQGNTFIVTEGNMGSGVVGKRTMEVDGRYIRGFIAPNYAEIAKKVSGKVKPDSSGSSSNVSAPNIYIQGVANGKWQKVAKNGTTSTGVLGKPLVGFAVKTDKGSVGYSAHVKNGGWLGTVTGWNYKDYNNGYAGNGSPAEKGSAIDAVKMYYKTPLDVVNKYGYYKVAYRVHLLGGGWLDWQYDTETTNGQDGYAGIYGTIIDAIEAKLVKA